MEYNIREDMQLLRTFFQLSQEELGKKLGVEKITISRTESGDTYPREELMDRLYGFSFEKGLRLNAQKELLYKEDLFRNHILLCHASKSGLDGEIEVNKGRVNNDFGSGFYCGESYDKSVSFISRFPSSCIYFIDFDATELKKVEYEVSTNWMLTIAYFRGTLNQYENNKKIKRLIKPVLDADYVIAPIADNRMFQIIDSFINGEITDEQCRHALAATNLGKQYVFKTQKSISQMKILERCFVSTKEKEYYQKEQISFQKDGEDKSKLEKIQYRGKGKYIEEILNEENR